MAALAAMASASLAGLPTEDPRSPMRLARALIRQLPPVTVKPEVRASINGEACILALGKNGKLSIGSDGATPPVTVGLVDCDLYNNSRATGSTQLVGASTLRARHIFLSGNYALSPGTLMAAAGHLTTQAPPVADPYFDLKLPLYGACTKPRFELAAGKTATIAPGVYCGGIFVAPGAALNLSSGTYILDEGGLEVGEGGALSGAGVTIVLTSRSGSNYGGVDFDRSSTIKLSAPAVASDIGTPGIALWVDALAPTSRNRLIGGDAQIINGAVYLPSQTVEFSGGSPAGTRCSQLIALTVSFTGNSYFRHDCTGSGISDPVSPPLILEEWR